MAKLESLFPLFPEEDEVLQEEFVRTYRERRAQDLTVITEYAAKKKQESLTDKEKALLKMLGIPLSQFKKLKDSLPDPEEAEQPEEEETEHDPGVFDSDEL
jgi:hypothetical protein